MHTSLPEQQLKTALDIGGFTKVEFVTSVLALRSDEQDEQGRDDVARHLEYHPGLHRFVMFLSMKAASL